MAGPESYRIELDGAGASFPCEAGETLLHAGLRAGLGMPYDCGSGGCGTCRIQRISGELASIWEGAPGLSARDRARGDRMLACQTRPRSDATIRAMLDDACRPHVPPGRLVATLARTEPVTHDMTEFVFQSSEPARFVPGQYALLGMPGVVGSRAYSMCNHMNTDGEWRFIVKRKSGGAFTDRLFGAGAEAEVTLAGPYGIAGLRQGAGRPVACIAGGSGLSPMVSIAAAALADGGVPQVDLFYGGRGRSDLFPPDRFPALRHDRLHVHTALSDAGGEWEGERGFIHELAHRVLVSRMAGTEFYVAGPPAMSNATVAMLSAADVARERVHFDSFL